MKKATKLILALATISFVAPFLLGQSVTSDGYTDFPRDIQTKNIPAGVVNEPGSQLIYLLDTGIDAKAEFQGDPKAPNSDYKSKSVFDLGGYEAPKFQNFLSVTNTNPTDAVTVHFRFISSFRVWTQIDDDPVEFDWVYFCEDILDFLVVLTCNDTMLIDPFNFEIPGAGINTSERFFKSASASGLVKGIPARLFDDGRFFLFVTSSGDLHDNNDAFADWLFPRELAPKKVFDDNDNKTADGLLDHCRDNDGLDDYIGKDKGIDDDNLHILNASAISFNFITGFSTIALPPDAIAGALSQTAYGVVAYARPAVSLGVIDATWDTLFEEWVAASMPFLDQNAGFYGWPDGDGPQAPKGVVLAGSEIIPISNAIPGDAGYQPATRNYYYLRNDVHGGDVTWENNPARHDSVGGALGWTLFPIEGKVDGVLEENQFLFMVSMADDYNGSNNAKAGGGVPFNDNSYGIDGANTVYDLNVWNNDEKKVKLPEPDVPISPPPPFTPVSLVIDVYCIDTFDASERIYDFDDFSIADLFTLGGSDVVKHIEKPVAVTGPELGPGWIRIVRSTTDVAEEYDGITPSFFTVAQQVTLFEGFGVSWWTPTAAYIDPSKTRNKKSKAPTP